MTDADRWSVLIDLTKQLVTVSGGVLAVLSTFAISGTAGLSGSPLVLLGLSLLALLVSVAAGLYSHAGVIWRLKELEEPKSPERDEKVRKAGNKAAACANVSFISFGVAALLLFGFGVLRATDGGADAAAAVRKSSDLLLAQGKIKGKNDWLSVERHGTGSGFEVKYSADQGNPWDCIVDEKGDLKSCIQPSATPKSGSVSPPAVTPAAPKIP